MKSIISKTMSLVAISKPSPPKFGEKANKAAEMATNDIVLLIIDFIISIF